MQTYRTKAVISQDGSLTIDGLPFPVGKQVQVIVLSAATEQDEKGRYPLRGTALQYDNPTEPIGRSDWDCD